ncbi:TfuA-like protein [Nocardiopsis potens]|uniref:TfuA-like protein n=1 Tax=Nocardiopsis potens TaxID=1246458 RepID=UPI000348C697|nr:TfuA-like protein [Nocardiopsis potens]
MTAVLFIGPSMPMEKVRSLFGGEIRPPIKRGDLPELMNRPEPPRHIGIVDGQFLHALSVAPKEVLNCIYRGISVYGASSMGALRGTECAPFGMTGIGEIFRMYRDGVLYADDEVAISYESDTLRPISEPMANIRVAVAEAVAAGHASPATAEKVLAAAKAMYFPDRSYPNLRLATRGELPEEEHARLFAFLTGPDVPDQKHRDAEELILALNAAVEADRAARAAEEVPS